MAFRTWGRLLLTALGVSVLAGAGQLGIAYGFGVVRLDGAFADDRWPAQLAWVGWFAAVAAVAGAVLTERLARRDGFPGGTTEQLSVAGVAALGAIVVAPLCMQPARAAELGGTVDPVWAVGICAILGAVVGAGASIAVLLKPPFGWNIVLTAAVVWLLALFSATPTVASARPLHTVRLGVLEPSWLDAGAAQRLAMLILPTVALLAGAAVGALARHRGHPPLVGGAAGVAGPVLLAFAYLTAGPGDTAYRYQLAPYYGALIAVVAGALGSAAATVLPRPATEAGSDAIEPSDILQPLPPSPAAPAAETSALAMRAANGTDHEPARTTDEREAGRTGTDRHIPAHWDWPVSSGLTPAPVPDRRAHRGEVVSGPDTHRDEAAASDERTPTGWPADPAPDHLAADRVPEKPTRADRVADEPTRAERVPDEPTRADRVPDEPRTHEPTRADLLDDPGTVEQVSGRGAGRDPRREAEDLMPALPVPGLLPPGRRTAAIDVLAAGRPAGHPPVEPAAPAAPVARLADPAPAAQPEPPTPAASAPDPSPRESEIAAQPATAEVDRPEASAAETPAPDRAAPAEPRPTGRSKRGRKGRASPAATVPAEPTASTEPVDSPGAPPPAEPPAVPLAEPEDAPVGEAPDASTNTRPSEQRFFFDPEPVGADRSTQVDAPASPRPRFPIFEDVPDGPGNVRPAWPIAPAPNWPENPHGDAGTGPDGTGGSDGTPTEAARVEPAPRPRHRALPDLGRSAGWDAFAAARHTNPGTPDAPPATDDGRHAAGTPPTVDTPQTGEHPAAPSEAVGEPGGGTAKQRRGLFRRNRGKAAEVAEADREAESLAQDEEYVDWVAGLASDDNADDARTLHTGRHHRD